LENVWTFMTILRGIVDQLRASNLLPADALTLVAKGLSKSSMPWFVSYIQQIQDNNSLGIKEYTIDDLLKHADVKYDKLFKSNEWVANVGQKPTSTDTAFIVKDVICYNCKKKGHIRRNCPEKDGGNGNGSGNDNGNGGGRKRHGRGKGKGPDPLRTPPKPGEPKVKDFKGKMLKWCGTCPKWGDHDNETHRAMIAASREQEQQKGTQNDPKPTTQGGMGTPAFAGLVSHF